ncbi:hypothetical protein [Lacrimispora sp.]|uniref:hypothetical protein n=1 Tax=Lacrimispora sp. TaxID=2719234 RepID=UPI0028B1912E|nr:hypothetical protein [Lacrimispora sp.]
MNSMKIYASKKGFNGLISSAEAKANNVSIYGCHLASIEKLIQSIETGGDAEAFGGTVIECSEGFYEYDYDKHCYCQA